MPLPRSFSPNFCAGDRVRVVSHANFRAGGNRVVCASWFDSIAGATGTVVQVFIDWGMHDLFVHLDRPYTSLEGEWPMWTICHAAHNFEYIDPPDMVSATSAPRTNIRAGDRVRGAWWCDAIAGAIGTVVEAIPVTRLDRLGGVGQDLLVRFDRAVTRPMWTCGEWLEDASLPGPPSASLPSSDDTPEMEEISDDEPESEPAPVEATGAPRRRLRGKQPPPPAYGAP